MEIYVHRSGEEQVELREVEETITVAEATGVGEDEEVWIEDVEESLDVTITLKEAGIKHHGHVHCGKCHKVAVNVQFNGVTKDRAFAPAATIARIMNWAAGKQGFDMTPTDKVEHVLQLCGTTTQPDESTHVGSLTAKEKCEVCFDLVPKHKFEG